MRTFGSIALVLTLVACGDGTGDADAGGMDAGVAGSDGGAADAASPPGADAGPGTDAGAQDGGATDGGPPDGGPPDAGARDTRCDEGDLLCDSLPPTCGDLEVAAIQDGCWACVNAITCRPWGEAGCETDQTCAPTERCDPCATGSCPFCEDCVAGCVVHGCPTETALTCRCARPDCGDGAVAVVRDGCWVCVTLGSCSTVREGC